jgi:hypothetical protein
VLTFVETSKSGHSNVTIDWVLLLLLIREVSVSNLDTRIGCLDEVLIMVAGSDFEMLEVQLTANVIVEN